MAKGKFFNGKVKKDHSRMIKYILLGAGIILIIILFILISLGKKNKTVYLELKSVIDVEVNSEKLKTEEFFNKLKNYDVDKITIGDYDITKIGTYEVEISTPDQGSQKITVNVVDTTPPDLKVKDLTVKSGATYKIEDFIESCKDNSNEECIVEYYDKSLDEEGNIVDYSKFSKDGKYIIKVIAKDNSDNLTKPIDVNLIIGEEKEETPQPPVEEPITCTYGDLTINTTLYNYPIAVIVGDQNKKCAINRDLWDSKEIVESVNNFYNTDYQRLKKQMELVLEKNYPYGTSIVAYPQYSAILNEAGTGLVGYGIYVTVYVSDARIQEKVDQQKNLKLAYYINSDGSREYKTNVFNIAE